MEEDRVHVPMYIQQIYHNDTNIDKKTLLFHDKYGQFI